METVAVKTPQRTKSQKIEDAIENARKLDSLNKAIDRLDGFLQEIAINKVDVYKRPANVKMSLHEDEVISFLASGIRSRIADLNREIDAIVESLP